MSDLESLERYRREEWVISYRRRHATADTWAAGYGPIDHSLETQARIFALADLLTDEGVNGDGQPFFEVLAAADRIACMGMWLVAHQTYARRVFLDGRDLSLDDFKPNPEGHTGGSLNMVPAYTGYLAINAITAQTRAWIMGQGHCVAAIDAVNLFLSNLTPSHAERYEVTDAGLTRYVGDFYGYRLNDAGEPDSPLGSHVNAHTAGGLAEGGYLGFTELQYVHLPLPGERLVAFLSDGAFEEQRGSDWAPRWWRAEDSGLVAPIMIANGRRIDQRTTMSRYGGTEWFSEHLRLNGFDPIIFDGRDPAAFAWTIFEIESRLTAAAALIRSGESRYPVALPYGVAVAPKGAGFYGEGTNLAHNLPLGANPHRDPVAAQHFNESARRLWVPPLELASARAMLQHHQASGRVRERDNPLANRSVGLAPLPAPRFEAVPDHPDEPSTWTRASPMEAIDETFLALVRANPHLRPRVGNPDEMRSNRMIRTLEALKFRVTDPDPDIPEAVNGAVITALNEETVASAALGNKGGINLVVTYEAFAPKMHGAFRQEITFARQLRRAGRPPGWLSVPLLLTSHTWENAKNEISHQDPLMAEAMLGEPSDTSRVLFVPDANTAVLALHEAYQTVGQIWTLVIPKAASIPNLFPAERARLLLRNGAVRLPWAGHRSRNPRVILTAVGAYQLEQVLRASRRLADRQVAHTVVAMLEPGRFRIPRDAEEAAHLAPTEVRASLYPESVPARVFVGHLRPETLLGTLQPLNHGHRTTAALGFINRGGTLSVEGMLFRNRCTWAHILAETARVLDLPAEALLAGGERAALNGEVNPLGTII